MENSIESTSKVETITKNSPEIRFQKLSENTKGELTSVEDPNVNESVPFVINYRQNEPTPEETTRVYRGVNYVAAHECPQIPSILKTKNIDQELINLTLELANNPSHEVYKKIKDKNTQLGNDNYSINKAENYIREEMDENNMDYSDGFKSMHRWENTASPYVSASNEINWAFSYAMQGLPGMVIVADIPNSLITNDFSIGFDKEVSVKGSIEQKYIKSILMVTKRHSVEDQPFIESVKKLIK